MTFLRKLKFVFIVSISLPSLYACALYGYETTYSAKSTEVWVVDADTNKPIEGVTAVAHWELSAGEMSARSRLVQLQIMEAVTDENGRLYFPAWGPKQNPTAIGYLDWNDPEIILFKTGYKAEFLRNYPLSQPRLGALRYSDWDGKTVKMQKVVSDKSYLENRRYMNYLIDTTLTGEAKACDWKHAPKTIAALLDEERLLGEKAYTTSSLVSTLRSNERYFSDNGCGSARAFLEGLRR